jgi:hypothetical protein
MNCIRKIVEYVARNYRHRQRKLDRKVLFPMFYAVALRHNVTEERVRSGLLFHFMHDPAWRKDFTIRELLELSTAEAKAIMDGEYQ